MYCLFCRYYNEYYGICENSYYYTKIYNTCEFWEDWYDEEGEENNYD